MSFWITCSLPPSLSPSLTSSKTLKWSTLAKLLKSLAYRVRAVSAAIDELAKGIAPAVFNSAGCRKCSSVPLTLSKPTSMALTLNRSAIQAQIEAGVISVPNLANCSVSNIFSSMAQ